MESVGLHGCVPLVAFERGGPELVENLFLGAIAVVDGDGHEVLALGDPTLAFPLRSTAKPFQLLPFLIDGLDRETATQPALEFADLAILMSSHSGEPMHVDRIRALLSRLGVERGQLRCGTHAPYHRETRQRLFAAGQAPDVLHCNCSGKHTAMLAVCAANGWPVDSYLDPAHPLQQRNHAMLCALGAVEAPLPYSIDGCSLPTWWVGLRTLARLFACLAAPDGAPQVEHLASGPLLAKLFAAGTAHPQLIAGSGRLDTKVMNACGRRVFAKTGASGMYALAVAPGPDHPRGLGVAFKVLDGDPDSAVRGQVVLALLRRLGIEFDPAALDVDSQVRNQRKVVVGRYRALPALRGD